MAATALRLVHPRAPVPIDPVCLLSDAAKQEAERCLAIIRPALMRVDRGVSIQAAAKWLAGSADGLPSWKTLQKWIADYRKGGLVALAPQYKGRQRKVYGWEAQAQAYYALPTKPGYSTVAYWLRRDGHADASDHLVRRYLQALPSDLTDTSRKRNGGHYVDQNIKPHVIRDNSKLPVGMVYEGDGHCCDVYVAHPATGKPVRPELTIWIDVRSHYVVGWWLSESESALTTLYSLSHTLVAHDNVPGFVHTDPGSGFIARMISAEVTGFLDRFDIDLMKSLPGNAKGKGLVEGWFRWFEERCGKQFKTYCGHDRTDDFLRHLTEKVKRGLIVLPTLKQYMDKIAEYITAYNAAVQDELGCAPITLWAQLEPVRLHTAAEAVIRPRETRTVARSRIKLEGRVYQHSDLKHYDGREVIVEYSIHDDEHVWIHDTAGRFLCTALLVEKKDWLPASRIEQKQQERLAAQHKRKLRDMEEQTARAQLPISSAASMLDALEAPAEQIVLPAPAESPLAIGHSFVAAVIPKAEPAPIRMPRAESTERAVAAVAKSAIADETSEQRYQRWIDAQASGAVPAELITWVKAYRQTPECRSFEALRTRFNNVVSGVEIPAGFQPL